MSKLVQTNIYENTSLKLNSKLKELFLSKKNKKIKKKSEITSESNSFLRHIKSWIYRNAILVEIIVLLIITNITLVFLVQNERSILDTFQFGAFDMLPTYTLVLFGLFLFLTLVYILKRFVFKFSKNRVVFGIWLAFLYFFIVSTGITINVYAGAHPIILESYPVDNEYFNDYTTSPTVEFNVPVLTENLNPSVVPYIGGEWVWEPYFGIPFLTKNGTLVIEETPLPNERFVSYFAGIQKLNDGQAHEHGFVFWTPEVPKVESTMPVAGSIEIPRELDLEVQLNKPSLELVDLEIVSTPELELEYSFVDAETINVTSSQLLAQGQTYTFDVNFIPKSLNVTTNEVITYGDAVNAYSFGITSVSEPLIKEFKPQGTQVLSDSLIEITFEEEINTDTLLDRLEITPTINGTWNFVDNTSAIFTPAVELPKSTNFTVTVKPGIESLAGGVIESEQVYEFRTIGEVLILATSPGNGVYNISEFTEIQITFNQLVDRQSTQNLFSISPAVEGSFEWRGNTIVFKPNAALSLSSTYSVTIGNGVKSVYGLDSSAPYTFSFTVRTYSYQMQIPQFYQQERFSCNINTALMILAWKGYSSSVRALIAEIGYNDKQVDGKWVGNPYNEFIGRADGDWGYGVYYPPLQRIFSARGIASEPRLGWNIADLTNEVAQGRPVIVWRYNGVGGGEDISWTAEDGTFVNAFNGMHGSVVSGFIGDPGNPTSIKINDPWLGELWMDVGTFDAYWSYSGRMALIVY